MNFSEVLSEVRTWDCEKRVDLIDAIWDGLAEEGYAPPITPELQAELERRLAEAEAHPDDTLTWEQVKADLRRQFHPEQ